MRLQQASGVLYEIFLGVRVHRDDLEQIALLLGADGFAVEYADATYHYDSLDEVQAKRGPHPKSISMSAHKREGGHETVSIAFNGINATLHWVSGRPVGSVAHQVKELLQARSSPLVAVLHPVPWAILFAIGVFLRASGWSFERQGHDAWTEMAVFGVTFLVIATGVRFGYAGVWLRRRHEGTFLKRNADQIWLLIVGAALGAVATAIASRIAGKD